MADDKKSDSKKGDSFDLSLAPVFVIVIVLILSAYISGETIFGNKVEKPNKYNIVESENIFSPSEWMGTGELVEGQRIINTKDIPVRNAPAGSILGEQDKLATGILRMGPVEMYGIDWWRVDYAEAPDGWVSPENISTRVGAVRTINIIPILYSFYQPIGYSLLFILLLLYIYFHFKLRTEEKISKKKKELNDEKFKEKEIPLKVLIEQKPDVQEIAGFQTEEIMPIAELEKQERWKHIQDLIKSYNSSDWRQAIIEADIILEEMLEKMGYDGVTIGDKLKVIERSDFVTLDKAWAAHKVRNQIAHDGSNFKLTRDVAEKTIRDFEDVFREFYYI